MKINKQFTTVTTFSKLLALGLFIVLPFLGFYLGYKFQKQTLQLRLQLLTVNSTWLGDPSLGKGNTFQIKYPSNYLVTNRDMYTYYKSQGGAGFPDLVLVKGEQFMNPYKTEDQAFDDLFKAEKDCVLIYRGLYGDIPGIANNEKSINGITLVSDQEKNIGKFKASLRKINIARTQQVSTDAYDAYIKLNNKHYYYFQTCNLNNKGDLITILENFDIREN